MLARVQLDPAHLRRCLTCVTLSGWCRIFPARHAAAPTGVGPGDSRFATAAGGHRLLYAAEDFRTAFVETVVRDGFDDGRGARTVDWVDIETRVWSLLDMAGPEARLRAVDLRGDGAVRLGVPTDVVRARDHAAGRAFGAALFGDHPDIDAVLFPSRLTGGAVVAVRAEAAAERLVGTSGAEIAAHPDLVAILEAYAIGIVPPADPIP
jgi:hypothetical protein